MSAEERKMFQDQLVEVVQQLNEDPDNEELKILRNELIDAIEFMNDGTGAEASPEEAPKPSSKEPPPPPPEPEKWSRENHPAFKKAAPPIDDKEEITINYQVNDTVLAKWMSGDRAFYPARITSITGSSTAPIYTVKFKSYESTDTLRARDIRPVTNKRKADGPPVPATAPAPSTSALGVVSSAGATVYPEAKRDGEKDDAEPKAPKPKKIKAKKELEAGKTKWQDFSSKSKFGKSQKKDSMFRTPEGVHGRVGFTGSGKAMRKDPTRSRHIYQTNDDLD